MRHKHDGPVAPHFPALPTGENLADYEGSKNWTNKQLAWEFLRRNKEFQRQCADVERRKISRKKRNDMVRNNFGLMEYKPFWEPYKADKVKRTRFVTADIGRWSRVTTKQQRVTSPTPHINVRPGDVLVRFNVRAIEKSRKAITAQLRDARILLEKRSEQWLKRKKSDVGIKSRRKGDLLCYLRLLDLIAYNDSLPKDKQKSRSQLFVMIFATDVERQKIDDVKASDYKDSFQRRKETSESFANDRYLDLAAS